MDPFSKLDDFQTTVRKSLNIQREKWLMSSSYYLDVMRSTVFGVDWG